MRRAQHLTSFHGASGAAKYEQRGGHQFRMSPAHGTVTTPILATYQYPRKAKPSRNLHLPVTTLHTAAVLTLAYFRGEARRRQLGRAEKRVLRAVQDALRRLT